MAQHALVWGSSGYVRPNPIVLAKPAQSANSTFQSDSAQDSVKPKSPYLAPRASAIKGQCFSEAGAAQIERGSTRSVYEAKRVIFTKWCLSNQVALRAPTVKSVADFLLHVFLDRKFQPSSYDNKDENLTHLLDSFHRDRPKG